MRRRFDRVGTGLVGWRGEVAPGMNPRASGVALVVASMLSQEAGAAVAVLVIPSLGALGMVLLRLLFSALFLLVAARPRIRGLAGRELGTVLFFGVALAAMNSLFYVAIGRVPLGAAVTLELLGPLTLSVVLGRRVLNALWVVVALGGVVLLGAAELAHLDAVGVMCALAAGACWAGYILASTAAGSRFHGIDGLALATGVAAVLTIPLGVAASGARLLDWRWLALGVVVALCSSVVSYAADLSALRRLGPVVFGVMMSLVPAVAALVGASVLRQPLSGLGVVAIGLVVAASAGSALTTPRAVKSASEGVSTG